MASPSCFTAKIDIKLAAKMEEDLKAQGFTLSKPTYTLFSAKKKGIVCTLYESGTLTVQGSEMGPFIEFYLEPEILQEFRFSHPEVHLDRTPHIGMDEAGKGDFFGPLCVAAVFADSAGIEKMHHMKVRDSKRISDVEIGKLAKDIRLHFPHVVIRLFPKKYNELYAKFKNLNRLLAWAHTAALTDLAETTGCKAALLDQFATPSLMESFLKEKKLDVHLEQKVGGESDLVVAAASILARAAFLDGLAILSEEYGITLPKGANGQVLEAARKIALSFGKEMLTNVAKTHFKTMNQATAE